VVNRKPSPANVDLEYGSPVDGSTPKDDETSSVSASTADEPAAEGNGTTSVPESPASTAESSQKPRRSYELWIAVLSMILTFMVGIGGIWFTYRAGAQHKSQETLRTQQKFIRDERVQVYTSFLGAMGEFARAFSADDMKTQAQLWELRACVCGSSTA
jgi:hypothetical protein